MSKIDAIREHYEHRIRPGRQNFDVLDWASEASQRKRFEVLVDHVPLAGRSLLDVGCGLGDLAAFLAERSIDVDYTGVDVLEPMVAACRRRFADLRFVRADVFAGEPAGAETFDVVFASGIFNLCLGNNLAFLGRGVRRMLELSSDTVVFNLLHVRSPQKEDDYFFYDPNDVLGLLPADAGEVRVLDDYLPNDFTVICRKRPAGPATPSASP